MITAVQHENDTEYSLDHADGTVEVVSLTEPQRAILALAESDTAQRHDEYALAVRDSLVFFGLGHDLATALVEHHRGRL